ncbi:MASE2 domain-containing protein [Fodinibius roseus]|uniref:histidine kinase n=1 Tax=Fodinibius roseus TaxID=1194090 RepID=A0A1M5DHK9_9BACT|nr:ATP-binding protein [Fodinibius roseus]SHF66478.1 MASE2 domain-containing protein [Fodinibius roseus]
MALHPDGTQLGTAHRLTRANYLPRVVGYGGGFLVISLLIIERGWSYWNLPLVAIFFLGFPQLVYLAAKAMPGEKRVEITAMMIESLVLGIWIVFMEFFLWESFALFSGALVVNTMNGGFKQMAKALLLFILGLLLGGAVMGFEVQLEGPLYIEIMAMIVLVFFIANAATSFFTQSRKLTDIRSKLEHRNNALNETIAELKSAREELVEKAHKAGMADLATGVLHNIGNILNSVNISATQIKETLSRSKFPQFRQANELLAEHRDDLEAFLLEDPRGLQLLNYYLKLEDPLGEEREQLKAHSERLTEKVQLMTEVIDAQQDVARVVRIKEEFQLEEVVEDTLMLQSGTIERDSLEIVKDFADTAKVVAQKSKLVHILINLLQNAKDAMSGMDAGQKRIRIRTYEEGEEVCLSVSDNGEGIREEHLKKIFAHGFTTREKGHGYGLHTCANYMSEMEGGIRAESEGKGKGATFILTFSPAGQKRE